MDTTCHTLNVLLSGNTLSVMMFDATQRPHWLEDYDHICICTDPCTVIVEEQLSVILKLKYADDVMATWSLLAFNELYTQTIELELYNPMERIWNIVADNAEWPSYHTEEII